jgi:dipeptidyl-peptidase 4
MMNTVQKVVLLMLWVANSFSLVAQELQWTADGHSYYRIEQNQIVQYTLPTQNRTVVINESDLTIADDAKLGIRAFSFSADQSKILIYTNTRPVWRLDTQGDYWVLDLQSKKLQQIGKKRTGSSLRFAKLSPDGSKVAYVSEYNVYVEDLASEAELALTSDGNRKLINGTFDWAYEEEFACRDGFQWSPDGAHIAFWQLDARKIRDFYMINNTDSVYSRIIPVEYPTAGESPSPARIGVVSAAGGTITWLAIPGDAQQHYLPRMEWNSPSELFVQQLNRKQNQSKVYNVNVTTNTPKLIYAENDEAWIDVVSTWENSYGLTFRHSFTWINQNEEFLWLSEKDGWRSVYRINKQGKEKRVINATHDVMSIVLVNEKDNLLYYYASPEKATQKYLYRTKLDGTGIPQRVTPAQQEGTHAYSLSPNGQYAWHQFQNSFTKPLQEFIELPRHASLSGEKSVVNQLAKNQEPRRVEFFKVKTKDGVEMDGWMVKPTDFDESKKYPVVFYVYTEPWGANVRDTYGVADNGLYMGDMAKDGYLYVSIDNRGTPAPKGRAWRKSIYRKVGRLNISDQADAAREIMKWNFVDASRVAVWGWSGGGSATLNLMFQYPDLYKCGIAVAAVGNQLTYDNIYQERYMSLPQENLQDFVDGSPITHAKKLQGQLLYIHGTGDDNVHFSNAEMLVNELVKHNKQFQYMAYPNRSHGIYEGEGTSEHLATLFTQFLQEHCAPGGR